MESYGFVSLIPALLTIALAIKTRNVIISLGVGALSGAIILQKYNPFQGLLYLVEKKIFDQISSPSNNQVLITIACIGGFIKIIETSGGAQAFAKKMTEVISSPVKAQLTTWLCGLAIFFSDSGNSLILGPLFSPIYKKLGICKEKLAYILDSTSAPICILIPFISWGAYIMSLIETTYADMGIEANPLSVLLSAMPYQFYAILTLLAVPLIAVMGKDFGPMLKAQKNYQPDLSELQDKEIILEGTTTIWAIAVPLIILFTCIAGLMTYYYLGPDGLTSVHIRTALLISYVAASIGAAIYTKVKNNRSMMESLKLFVQGGGSMIFIFYILILAWTLSSVCKELQAGQYIAANIKSFISPGIFPMIIFFLGALISVSTGTSYGTFAILMPLALPVALDLQASLVVTLGAILSGGLFGDHTSPISDTTVIASMGAECEHMKHVNTQMFYSVLTASVAACCYLVAARFESPLVLLMGMVLMIVVLSIVMSKFGQKISLEL
jgi:Na+/H+ antiporter NhaC